MILKQGHKYEPMPHDGKLIAYIYRGGRCYYIASPYSPEATQALKAAFPQYWTAIRDYGWANPALVPFINEDPMLIVSLVEVGKTRWLWNDNVAYIDIATSVNQDLSVEAKARMFAEAEDQAALFSSGVSNANGYHLWAQGGKYGRYGTFTYGTQKDTGMTNMPIDQDFKVRTEKNKVTYTLADGTLWYTKELVYRAFSYTTALRLFGLNYNGQLYAGCNLLGGMDNVKIWNGEELAFHLLPFIRNGENGMLDILSGTFHPNANTEGTFTIQLTDKAT